MFEPSDESLHDVSPPISSPIEDRFLPTLAASVGLLLLVFGDDGSNVISKLRKDAALQYLYAGPKKPGPGAPKKYDGKVYYDDLKRWEWMGEVEEGVSLLTAVVWHNSLQRRVRVSMLYWHAKGTPKHVLLFSTDAQMDAWRVYRIHSPTASVGVPPSV